MLFYFRIRVSILVILLQYFLIFSHAVDSPLQVLESTNGIVYLLGNPDPSNTSQSTPTRSGATGSVTTSAKPARVLSSLSSVTGTGARARVDGDPTRSAAFSFSNTAASISSIPFPITSTASETWPASVTFVSQSGSVTVVEIGFLTTSDGTTCVTNTQPQQSLISATGSGHGLIAVTESGTVTTLSLSSLPTATSLSQPTGIQVVTESGSIITYSPYYLSGYTNSKPIEIYATFGENVNGKITSQAGWWLIGAGGEIDPPGKQPWNKGGGHSGCLLGPLFCHTGWIIVGGGLVIPGPIFPGPVGPPGYPGGPVNGNGEPGDDPPPNDGDDDPESEDQQTATKSPDSSWAQSSIYSVTTSSPISSRTQSSISSSASSEGTAQYYTVLEAGADQTPVDETLEEFIPGTKSVQPDLAANVVDGGFYIGYNLTSEQARNISSLSEVWVINTYTNGLYSFSDPASSTAFTTTAVLATYTGGPAYASSTGTPPAKIRREPRREVSRLDTRSSRSNNLEERSAELDGAEMLNSTSNLQKRDTGRDLVWQVNSPKDLSVLSWAPGTNFDDVDYVMEETKGEGTWVILMDTGVTWQHQEFRGNWPDYGKFNIDTSQAYLTDPTNRFLEGYAVNKEDYDMQKAHGTCMASKICGKTFGVAKQTIVIPVIVGVDFESFLAGLNQVLSMIPQRRANGEVMPGKTVLSISMGWSAGLVTVPALNLCQRLLQSIMNLGVIGVTSAGNNALREGVARTDYPAQLSTPSFPLIAVGGVTLNWEPWATSQNADVYLVGVEVDCADGKDKNFKNSRKSTGTSAACASFAGKIAYMLARSDNPFGLSYAQSAWSSYQRIVKTYYTVGYSSRHPSAHPPGSWYRNGNAYPVAWNGLDGTQKTLCSKRLTAGGPGGAGWVKKREANDDEENPAVESVCAAYSSSPTSSTTTSSAPSATPTVTSKDSVVSSSSPTSSIITSSASSATPTVSSKGSIVIYTSHEKCELSQICPVTWWLYSVAKADDYPSNVCTANPIAQHDGVWFTNSINFSLKGTAGTFVYTWTNDDSAGSVTGPGIPTPVSCTNAPRPTPSTTCERPESVDRKRDNYPPAVPPGRPTWYQYLYEEWASCSWG